MPEKHFAVTQRLRIKKTNAELWWIRPHTVFWLVLFPIFIALPLLPGPPKDVKTYFTSEYYILGIGLLVLIGCAAWVGQLISPRSERNVAHELAARPWTLDLFFALALLAYGVWFFAILRDPTLLIVGVQRGAFEIKETVPNIPGITSFTQAGVAFFICYFTAVSYCRQRFHARFRVYAVTLIVLACLRVFVWTEREALIEIIVPVVLLVVSSWRPQRSFFQTLLLWAPVIGLVALVLFFGITEYTRSWISFYADGEDNFWLFMTTRVSNYYVTAVNNALAFLTEDDYWPRWQGANVFSGFYAMPVVGEFLKDAVNFRADGYAFVLETYLDPEFNNLSALYIAISDFGVAFGTILLIAFGIVAGMLWKLFANRKLGGLLFYPLIYMTIIELLRVMYLGGARSIIPLFCLVLAYFLGFRRRDAIRRPVSDSSK